VVIYDFAGEPMACAVLPTTTDVKTAMDVKLDQLKPFPGPVINFYSFYVQKFNLAILFGLNP